VFGKPAVLVGLRWSVLPVNDNIFYDDRFGHFTALGAAWIDRHLVAIWKEIDPIGRAVNAPATREDPTISLGAG
jgi:hypothetical protein